MTIKDAAPKVRVFAVLWLLFMGVIGPCVLMEDDEEPVEEEADAVEMYEGPPIELPTLSIEEYAKYDGHHNVVSDEFRTKVIATAYKTKKEIEASNVKHISLQQTQIILEQGGENALLAVAGQSGSNFVHHDRLDMYMSIEHFLIFYNVYKRRGFDFFKEKLTLHKKPNGEPALDKEGRPVYLLSLMSRDLHYIYKKTGKWIEVASGVRSANYKLVVWGRSLQECLDKGGAVDWLDGGKIGYYWNKLTGDTKELEKICSSAVREDVAAKPKTLGNGHAAMDIKDWNFPEAYELLLQLMYVGGCESLLWPVDGWHWSFVTKRSPIDKRDKCLSKEGLTAKAPR